MERETVILGSENSLRIAIEWRSDYESNGPVGRTWGDLELWVEDTLVWGSIGVAKKPTGITWSWIDLLEFLANAWPYLANEEQHPIEFANHWDEPPCLGQLWGYAQVRWSHVADEVADREDEALRNFFAVHDFAEALRGAQPPQFLLMRQGELMIASTAKQQWELSYTATMSTLVDLGDSIAERIDTLTDARSTRARERWTLRDSTSFVKQLQIATGRSADELAKIWPTDISAPGANDDRYELRAAARMIARSISDDQLKKVLEFIYRLPKGRPAKLDPLRAEATVALSEINSSDPALQGYILAALLRKNISRQQGKIDPDDILKNWGVEIHKVNYDDLPLDAIAVWALDRTPTVLLNQKGPRARHPSGSRSTLAHEICHILVDTDGALPVVEVLGGAIPHAIEQRANAFAAELLLPQNIVSKEINTSLKFTYLPQERELEVNNVMGRLSAAYGVSHETIAWQIINSKCLEYDLRLIETIKKNYLNSIKSPFSF